MRFFAKLQGGIVGSMVGNCSFFEIADDIMHRASVMYLQDKKKTTCKRITSFQFSPSNPSEVVVSSNDSLVRILKGADIICKLRGCVSLIDRRSKVYASFTADGKHIISATDDSNAYIWSHINNERTTNSKPKNIWSSESFSSPNALIAVPWHGFTSNPDIKSSTTRQPSTPRHKQESSVSSGNYCSVKKDKGSSTAVLPAKGDIDYEFLRNVCESILSGSHMWGLVIVTGGKDGFIRTYHNYGLPVRCPTGKSLKSSFSLSNFRYRCIENCSSLGSSTSFD
ncbi:WD repeat-containing protein 44-like isoform X2 [Chenopodium quinoa]|uniref:WD repeat-containing protein 44-like isoform X2 n=1 Tax=Chenopodium quinoa TaxID=63459 RepID=UPI000B78B968|nr:WD repeat-containing protein 44-like isoform X2 [Chenopodium quinoa]